MKATELENETNVAYGYHLSEKEMSRMYCPTLNVF